MKRREQALQTGLIGWWIAVVLCACALAQTPAPGSPSPGSLDAALAIESPTERIAALQKFLKTNSIADQAQTAREALVTSYAQLGETQLTENSIDRATEEFRRAIGALPEKITDSFFEEAVLRIPLAVSVRGYRSEAILLARSLEKRFAKETPRLARIGEFYLTIEAPADAIRALEAAAALAEEEATLHRALAAAYRMGLRLDDAIAEYQQAVRYDEKDKRAYYELGNLYRAHGAFGDAIKLYRQQLRIDPKHTASYKGLALALLSQGKDDEAASALNQARDIRGGIEELSQDIYLQTQLAFHYLSRNKLKQARQASESALLIEPRYAWARIAAAEIDMAEGKYFEAERHLLAAKSYASFPTLFFTLGKLYLSVEDFDGALEQFANAFTYSQQSQFSTKLGGTLDIQADGLRELLSREHQAAIYLAESPTSDEQFKIAESLVKFNIRLRLLKAPAPVTRPARSNARNAPPADPGLSPEARKKLMEDLDQAAMSFVEAENVRRSFRMLYIAERLAQASVASGLAIELAEQALGLAEVAVESDGSLRDYPNFDRPGRLQIFRGRSLDAKGWALFKSGNQEAATATLKEAAQAYGSLPERKRALQHLAEVKETAGELNEALEFYLAAYEPSENSGLDVNRAVIESLYRKLHGSLDGLDKRLAPAPAPPQKTDAASLSSASLKPAPAKPDAKPAPRNARRSTQPKPAPTGIGAAPDSAPAPAPVKIAEAPAPTASEPAPPVSLPSSEPAGTLKSTPSSAANVPTPEAPAIVDTTPPPPAPKPVELPPAPTDDAPRLPFAPMDSSWVASLLERLPAPFLANADEPPPPPQPTVHTRKRRVSPAGNPQ